MRKIISPSILGYESCLEESIEKIWKMINWGIEWLHVDVIRDDFIHRKNTFSEELIFRLYNEFKNKVNFDFHLMISNPDELIEIINKMIDSNKRKDTNITIHREAYRKSDSLVYKTLKNLKDKNYRTGIALNPRTNLKEISKEMVNNLDMILLMGVNPGAGNQRYMEGVTEKIKEIYKYFNLMIQIDGGMNEETIPRIIDYVDNVVVGSYITNNENPIISLDNIKNILNRKY